MNPEDYDDYEIHRQSTLFSFFCGAIIGLLTGAIATLAILEALGKI